MSFLHLVATRTLELGCVYTASFSKELKVFCAGEETDRQICTLWRFRPLTRGQARAGHSFSGQTTGVAGGSWGPGGEIRPGGRVTQRVISIVGLAAAGAPLPSSFEGFGPDHQHRS